MRWINYPNIVPEGFPGFPQKAKDLTLDGGFQTRRFRLKLIPEKRGLLLKLPATKNKGSDR